MFEATLGIWLTWADGVRRWRQISPRGRRPRERGVERARSLIVIIIIIRGGTITFFFRRIFHLVTLIPGRCPGDPASRATSAELKLASVGEHYSSVFLSVSSLSWLQRGARRRRRKGRERPHTRRGGRHRGWRVPGVLYIYAHTRLEVSRPGFIYMRGCCISHTPSTR